MDQPIRMRVVSPPEMFFSLTDRAGVITGASSVFQRIARLSLDELLEAPHNIIRNPAMPGGVFRLMWDTLLAGRPFAGYVLNLASDGVGYWVFATVTPVPDGFLSVRIAPCDESLWMHAAGLYEEVLAKELRARENGMNRRQAAEYGRDLILEGLGGLGFASYEDFMAAALPVEVDERARRAESALKPPPDDADPTMLEIRQLAMSISSEVSTLLAQLEEYRSLSTSLGEASLDASAGARGLADASAAARVASAEVATQAPAVFSTARAMEKGGQTTLSALEELAGQLDRDQRLLRGLQIRIALAKLHSDMAVSFANEILEQPDDLTALGYLPTICGALEATIKLLAEALKAHSVSMGMAAASVEQIAENLGQFQSFLFMWRNLLIRHGVSDNVSRHLSPIDRQLNTGSAQVVTLRYLARKCNSQSEVRDTRMLLSRVRKLAAAGQAAKAGGRSVATAEAPVAD